VRHGRAGTAEQCAAACVLSEAARKDAPTVREAATGVGETQRTVNGSTSHQWDGSGISQQTDSSGTTSFTTTPDGTLLSETIPSGSNAGTYYYLSDGAGDVAALTDGSGNAVDSYSYDPLGNATSSGSVPNPFTFQGWQFDSQTGYYYTGSGYYDPATAQSFGCHDKGPVDPGEDLCGEDENPTCGGVCISKNPHWKVLLGGMVRPEFSIGSAVGTVIHDIGNLLTAAFRGTNAPRAAYRCLSRN